MSGCWEASVRGAGREGAFWGSKVCFPPESGCLFWMKCTQRDGIASKSKNLHKICFEADFEAAPCDVSWLRSLLAAGGFGLRLRVGELTVRSFAGKEGKTSIILD